MKEFKIPVARKAWLNEKLTKLARKANKLGSQSITWVYGEPFQVRHSRTTPAGKSYFIVVDMIPITLDGAAPRLDGWTFIACLEHVVAEQERLTIIHALVDGVIPDTYRTRAAVCEHCNIKRARRDTYVVRHDDGRMKQVGSTCLVDFTGHPNAEAYAAMALAVGEAFSACEDAEEWGGGGGSDAGQYDLTDFLAHVAAEIRESGWLSRAKANERGIGRCTADDALDRIHPHPDVLREEQRKGRERDRSVTDTDTALAAGAVAWAESLSREGLSDYLWNIHVLAKTGCVNARRANLAASIVASHMRAEERKLLAAKEAAVSQYIGTVGKREMFTLTLTREIVWDSGFGTTHLYKFLDEAGNAVVWKSSRDLELTQGTTYKLKGTVKKHDEYNGVKQTTLSRCVIESRTEAA